MICASFRKPACHRFVEPVKRRIRHALEGEECPEIVFRRLPCSELDGFAIGRHRAFAFAAELPRDSEADPDGELIGLPLNHLLERFAGGRVVLTSRLRVGARDHRIGRGGCDWCLGVGHAGECGEAGEDQR